MSGVMALYFVHFLTALPTRRRCFWWRQLSHHFSSA